MLTYDHTGSEASQERHGLGQAYLTAKLSLFQGQASGGGGPEAAPLSILLREPAADLALHVRERAPQTRKRTPQSCGKSHSAEPHTLSTSKPRPPAGR